MSPSPCYLKSRNQLIIRIHQGPSHFNLMIRIKIKYESLCVEAIFFFKPNVAAVPHFNPPKMGEPSLKRDDATLPIFDPQEMGKSNI
jgi:hypothetical protein